VDAGFARGGGPDDHAWIRTHIRFSSAKDPPNSWAVNLCWRRMTAGFLRPETHLAEGADEQSETVRFCRRWVAIGKLWLALCAVRSSTSRLSRHCLRSGGLNRTSNGSSNGDSQNIGEAQATVPSMGLRGSHGRKGQKVSMVSKCKSSGGSIMLQVCSVKNHHVAPGRRHKQEKHDVQTL
jgi:hypothetical protein